jgi:pheophorbide a oxygenase
MIDASTGRLLKHFSMFLVVFLLSVMKRSISLFNHKANMKALLFMACVALLCGSSLSLSSPSAVGNDFSQSAKAPATPPRSTTEPSLNQKSLDDKKFPRTWVPIASTYELDPDRPTPLQFLGQKYVTYQDNDENWVVLDDVCPHRLAPLSEGRVDREKNAIQCSYHGWEYNSTGNCIRIPQANAEIENSALSSTRSSVASYPAYVENKILFVWPWKEDVLSIAGKAWACPEGMMEKINPVVATFTRDLPYGWEALVENLIDPSHVPFAHHGLQGKRSDAIPINMTFPTVKGEEGFSFNWEDRTMGMMRAGEGAFRAPYLVWYDADFESDSPKRFELSVFCVPTKPGWSRAIILTTSTTKTEDSSSKQAEKKTTKGSLIRAAFKIIPVWMIHMLSNRFLDSDLAFLHFQERELERQDRPTYFMPAPADRCIGALRKWIPKYTDIIEPLPPALSRSDMFDRYSQHSIHCKHCQAGQASLQKWRRRTYVALTASVLGFKFRIAKVSLLLSLGLLRLFHKLGRQLREGDFKHYENH